MRVEAGVIPTTRSLNVLVLDNMFTSCHPRSNNIRWHWGFLGPTPEFVYQAISLTGSTENCHDLQLNVYDIQYHVCHDILKKYLSNYYILSNDLLPCDLRKWNYVWLFLGSKFELLCDLLVFCHDLRVIFWCYLSSIFHYFQAIGTDNFTVRNCYAEETQICSVCHEQCVMWVCLLSFLTCYCVIYTANGDSQNGRHQYMNQPWRLTVLSHATVRIRWKLYQSATIVQPCQHTAFLLTSFFPKDARNKQNPLGWAGKRLIRSPRTEDIRSHLICSWMTEAFWMAPTVTALCEYGKRLLTLFLLNMKFQYAELNVSEIAAGEGRGKRLLLDAVVWCKQMCEVCVWMCVTVYPTEYTMFLSPSIHSWC